MPTDPSGEAASNDQADPHQAAQTDPEVPGCWCCGASCPESDLVRLGAHPAVGVCVDCAHFLHRRARAIRGSALTRRLQIVGDRIRDGVCVDCAHFLHRRARAIRGSALTRRLQIVGEDRKAHV